jgi:signal transduction histidine kinase/PAS domain-containing protein
VVAFAAALCLVIALVLAALLRRTRLQLREATGTAGQVAAGRDLLRAHLDSVPLTWFGWRRAGDDEAVGGPEQMRFPDWATFAAQFSAEDAAPLETAVRRLRQTGAAFSQRLAGWQVEGRRTADGTSLVWVLDAAETAAAEANGAAATAAAHALRQTLDAMPLPVWRRGADLYLVDCNQAYAAALDTPREQVLAESRELATGGSRDTPLALAREAQRTGPQSQRRHVVIGGARRLLEVTELPEADGGTIGFAIDRTETEAAEAELWRHVNAHAETLENIHAAVAIYGADKRLKFHNASFAALWGLEEDWLATEPALDEVLERLRERRRLPEVADFPTFKRQLLDHFTGLIEPQQELVHLPDERTLRLAIVPHPFGGLTFVYEDVTDRLALERSYNTLSEVQRETLDHLYEGITVWGSDGRLKLHNPAYRRIWGLLESDVAGEPHISQIVEKIRDFFDDGGDWAATRNDIIARVTAHTLSSGPLDRRDGSVLEIANVPLPDGNVLSTCLDVTDTARVERALRERNEALETAGRLKSEFIANVSYELRNPLNAVIGFAEMLNRQYFGTLSPRQLEYSRNILDSAHQLMSLINDILDLATIEAGYMTLETGEVDVDDLLRSVVTLTHERARNRDLTLDCRCPPGIGAIAADERRLKQALFNLVSNAIKFTPAGGTVTLAAERHDGELALTVSDTGIGIPSADQERVFDKFERGDPQARESGAGLGLSLVKNLIELHGGTVTLTSALGRGTTVSCRLPARPPAAVAADGE